MVEFPSKSDSFYTLLGKTLVLFEEMVDAEKSLAGAIIQESGLKDASMAESLVAHLNAEDAGRWSRCSEFSTKTTNICWPFLGT